MTASRHLQQLLFHIIEKIQRRAHGALKIIYSDIPYEACMQEAQIELLNPIRPGYFRQLTIRGGGGFKSPPPYDLENYYVNRHYIIHVNFTRCFRHDPIGIFQKFAILTILQRFQNKK